MTDVPAIATPAAPLLFGRYRVQEQLGDGRLATLYGAFDERLQRRVLIHLLRKDYVGQEPYRQRFLSETSTWAQRSHPALLEVFDSGEAGQRPYVVTEYFTGQALRGVGAITLEQALLYMRQVASAVAACQARTLPHPPISSANVFLVAEGRVKLIESWNSAPADALLDLAHYRPPERTLGRPLGAEGAVYSLGILLYELITGTRPITGTDAQAVATAHLTTRIAPLAAVRPTLCLPSLTRLIERATARMPAERPADALAFSVALDAVWQHTATNTQRFQVPVAAARPLRSVQKAARALTGRLTAQPPALPPTETLRSAPLVPPTDDRLRPVDRSKRLQRNLWRGIGGWVVMLTMILTVGCGAYVITNRLADRIAASQSATGGAASPTPNPTGEMFIVNITEGLNIRDLPGLHTTIITNVPNGTPVSKVAGPQLVDNVNWLKVRAEVQGKTIEGWMSLNYLTPEQGS